jgi:hypothetical protein
VGLPEGGEDEQVGPRRAEAHPHAGPLVSPPRLQQS